MIIEVTIYVFIALIFSSIRRIISGMKNGCFYAKGNPWTVPQLDKYIKNLHFLETPAWYFQFGAVFLFYFALLRTTNYSTDFIPIFIQLLSAYLVTMGSSAMASYHFQGYINVGSNLPFDDEKENKKSEFAFGKTSIWWTRPSEWLGIVGKKKKWNILFGFVLIVIGLYLGLIYK